MSRIQLSASTMPWMRAALLDVDDRIASSCRGCRPPPALRTRGNRRCCRRRCARPAVRDHDAFAVEEVQLVLGRRSRSRWQAPRRLARLRRAQRHVLVRDDPGPGHRAVDVADAEGAARGAISRVAAHVIGVVARVDDADDRLRRAAGPPWSAGTRSCSTTWQPSGTPDARLDCGMRRSRSPGARAPRRPPAPCRPCPPRRCPPASRRPCRPTPRCCRRRRR